MFTWLYQTLPVVAVVGFLTLGLTVALQPSRLKGLWMVPAALSLLFLIYSVFTISVEGPGGFWTEHLSGAWGNQIWLDLLLSIGVAFALLAPRARALGMHPLAWFIAIACTGGIGLLAMLARYLQLAGQAEGAIAPTLANGSGR